MPDMEQEKDDLLRRLSVLDAERRSIADRLQNTRADALRQHLP